MFIFSFALEAVEIASTVRVSFKSSFFRFDLVELLLSTYKFSVEYPDQQRGVVFHRLQRLSACLLWFFTYERRRL